MKKSELKFKKISEKSIYVTIFKNARCHDFNVGDLFELRKEKDNSYDDEAIIAVSMEDYLCGGEDWEEYGEEERYGLYVANSVRTVARGTYSAGRLYDKFEGKLYVEVKFVTNEALICKIIGEEEKKEIEAETGEKKEIEESKKTEDSSTEDFDSIMEPDLDLLPF